MPKRTDCSGRHPSNTPETKLKNSSRPAYRLQQFLLAMHPPAQVVETAQVSAYLTPPQLVLFRRLQRSEQWHALIMLQKLSEAGESDPDLLTAALLHDIGKILYPLKTWERVLIVLMKRISPWRVERWGRESPQGLAKAFVVACQHAGWGADLAKRAGASELTVELIRRHEDQTPGVDTSQAGNLLHLLRQVDDSS
jgi:hypothetical protein